MADQQEAPSILSSKLPFSTAAANTAIVRVRALPNKIPPKFFVPIQLGTHVDSRLLPLDSTFSVINFCVWVVVKEERRNRFKIAGSAIQQTSITFLRRHA